MTSGARLRVLLYVVMALQAAKMGHLVPIDTILDGSALTPYRYSQMYADIDNDRRFTALSHRAWGYDPYVGAGGPVGAGFVEESHAPILFDRLLRRWLDPSATIKIFLWIAFLLGPVLIFGAGRLFGLRASAVGVALLLHASGSLGHDFLSQRLLYRGNVSFWLGAHLALFSAACLFSAAFRDRRRAGLGFLLTLPILFLLDPLLGLVEAAPVAAIIMAAPAGRRRGLALWVLGALALAAALNAFWVRPMLMFSRAAVADVEWRTLGLLDFFSGLSSDSGGGLALIGSFVRMGGLVFGVAEFAALARQRNPLFAVGATWAVVLFALTFFGYGLPDLRAFEPARLAFLLALLITLPAGTFIADVFLRPGSFRILVFGWGLWMLASWQAVHDYFPRAIRSTFSPMETRLLTELRRLPADRRVLVQYEPRVNDALRIGGAESGKLFLGFPSTWRSSVFALSGTFETRHDTLYLFGKPVSQYETEDLRAALERYNVGTVVITSAPAQGLMTDHSRLFTLRPGSDEGPWFYDAALRPNHFVMTGRGRATATRDRIRVSGAGPGLLTLGFHWVEGLAAVPPLPLSPHYLAGDPVPFIAVDNSTGIPAFEIRYEAR